MIRALTFISAKVSIKKMIHFYTGTGFTTKTRRGCRWCQGETGSCWSGRESTWAWVPEGGGGCWDGELEGPVLAPRSQEWGREGLSPGPELPAPPMGLPVTA